MHRAKMQISRPQQAPHAASHVSDYRYSTFPGPVTSSINSSLTRRLDKKRGKEAARWHCPLGCGKYYRKSSSRSIQKHRVTCFNNYMRVQSPGCTHIFENDLRLQILKNANADGRPSVDPEKYTASYSSLWNTVVHFFCVGGVRGKILSTFRSPLCTVPETELRYQCGQILIHAAKSETEMVQMMVSNSELVYYHQKGVIDGRPLIFIIVVSAKYKGDPVGAVLGDFRKTYKAKWNHAAQQLSPEGNFSFDFMIDRSSSKCTTERQIGLGIAPRNQPIHLNTPCPKWKLYSGRFATLPRQCKPLSEYERTWNKQITNEWALQSHFNRHQPNKRFSTEIGYGSERDPPNVYHSKPLKRQPLAVPKFEYHESHTDKKINIAQLGADNHDPLIGKIPPSRKPLPTRPVVSWQFSGSKYRENLPCQQYPTAQTLHPTQILNGNFRPATSERFPSRSGMTTGGLKRILNRSTGYSWHIDTAGVNTENPVKRIRR
eukprot:jgi/Bigna1/77043/fgenesh1_pg.45_\